MSPSTCLPVDALITTGVILQCDSEWRTEVRAVRLHLLLQNRTTAEGIAVHEKRRALWARLFSVR